MAIRTLIAMGMMGIAADAQSLPAQEAPSWSSTVDSLVAGVMTRGRIPGMSVAVALDGRLVWSRGYGVANLEHGAPVTSSTTFRSASIGKPVTAVGAMLLAESGRLDLDAPVQQYCPAFPAKRWPLTARHLLAHTGGIRHYGGDRNFEEQTSNRHYARLTDWLPVIADDTLLFQPGTRWSYSTYGYNLLGCVIEGASGQPFLEYMRDAVFTPAGMTQTRDDDPAAIIAGRSAGYVLVDGELRHATFVDMSNRMPAGGYLTTAADLARFGAVFGTGGLVRPATRDSMLTYIRLADGSLVSYGLGWGLYDPGDSFRGLRDAFHGGGSPGVTGFLYIVPSRGFAVAMLMNLEAVGSARSALSEAITEAVLFPPGRR